MKTTTKHNLIGLTMLAAFMFSGNSEAQNLNPIAEKYGLIAPDPCAIVRHRMQRQEEFLAYNIKSKAEKETRFFYPGSRETDTRHIQEITARVETMKADLAEWCKNTD